MAVTGRGYRRTPVLWCAINCSLSACTSWIPPGVCDRGLQEGAGPMAIKPEGQQSGKADRVYNRVRWLGPIYTIYKIVREFLAT